MTEPTAGCLHDYALTTEDLKKLARANVLITNGAGLESFLDKITGQKPDLQIIEASKDIDLIPEEEGDGYNPHVWVSISNAIAQVQTISDQLALIDPSNAAKYQENAGVYIAKLEAQKVKMLQALDSLRSQNVILFDDAPLYFVQEFNFQAVAVLEREPGSTLSVGELNETINLLKDQKNIVLFAEPEFPPKTAAAITAETGLKVHTLDPVVTGPLEADAYIKIMDENLQTLQEALQ